MLRDVLRLVAGVSGGGRWRGSRRTGRTLPPLQHAALPKLSLPFHRCCHLPLPPTPMCRPLHHAPMRPPRLTLPLALPPACPQRVSYARTTSNKVVMLKGGKAAKQLAKGKPPKAPAAAAAEGEGAPKKAKQAEAAAGGKAAAAAAGVDVGRPNSKLFIENLPAATTAAMLEMLFQQFPGALAGGGGRGAGQMLGGEGSRVVQAPGFRGGPWLAASSTFVCCRWHVTAMA